MLHLFGSINTLWYNWPFKQQSPFSFPLRATVSFAFFLYFLILTLFMARLTHICVLFLVLVLSHELLGTEGRSLKQSIQSPDANKGISIVTSTAKRAIASQSYRIIRSLAGDVEAFRPTTPGHSPGVGH